MNRGLVIVDVQNDYFSGQAGLPLFHVQHIATQPGATFFVPGSAGCEINPLLQPREEEAVVQKHYPSAFRDTDLHQRLHAAAVEQLVICGAMSHMCIDTTARAAFDLGYRCQLAADACATRDLEFAGRRVAAADVHAAFMAALASPFAQVMSTDELLAGTA